MSLTDEDISEAYRARLDHRDPQARIVVADLARTLGVAVTSHVPGDPTYTAFNEGRRSAFIYIADRIGLPLIPEA